MSKLSPAREEEEQEESWWGGLGYYNLYQNELRLP